MMLEKCDPPGESRPADESMTATFNLKLLPTVAVAGKLAAGTLQVTTSTYCCRTLRTPAYSTRSRPFMSASQYSDLSS